MARVAIRVSVSPAMLGGGDESSWSAPEQKPRPTPVRITTRTSLSAAAASSASCSGTISSNDIEFIRSGRFSVTTRTCGRGSSTITYDMCSPCWVTLRCQGHQK